MARTWIVVFFAAFTMACGQSFAAKPQGNGAPAVASQIFAVKVDYVNGQILVEGENLDPGSTTATLAGVALSVDPSSTATTLVFPFSPALSAAVSELGTYVLILSTGGNNFTLSLFIPLGLEAAPIPPPAGPDCPCSTEWDIASTSPSPDGFSGLTPYCSQDAGDFVTVQFYDLPANNYWVLWTGWSDSEGYYCELFVDGPYRSGLTQDQYDACAAYLRNIVTVWEPYNCLF